MISNERDDSKETKNITNQIQKYLINDVNSIRKNCILNRINLNG